MEKNFGVLIFNDDEETILDSNNLSIISIKKCSLYCERPSIKIIYKLLNTDHDCSLFLDYLLEEGGNRRDKDYLKFKQLIIEEAQNERFSNKS